MYNIFYPYVVVLTFCNNFAHWMGVMLLPQYFVFQERIFIAPLESSVRSNEIFHLASLMTYPPELDVDAELIYSALRFAENVPDSKTCFPEIWGDIIGVCSRESTLISEYEYVVMAFRIFNCMHHRSLGIEEYDFESINQDYIFYLATLTDKDRILFHKMYNVARGLCLSEKQERATRDLLDIGERFENNVDGYLNLARRIKIYLAKSVEVNTRKAKRKHGFENISINKTGRLLQEVKQKSEEKYMKYIEVMRIAIDKSTSVSESVETSMNGVAKNFGGIIHSLEGEKSFQSSWYNFEHVYSRKTAEMERKLASIEMKLGEIYKAKLR